MFTITIRATAPVLCLVLTLPAPSQSPQAVVVPLAYQQTAATGQLMVSAGQQPIRMQTLIGPSHLQPLLGR